MTDNNVQQVVLAKSPAELEAERRAQLRKALQQDLATVILASELAENNDGSDRHSNDYTRVISARGCTWVAVWEDYSRRYLRNASNSLEDGTIVEVPAGVLVDSEGNGERLESNYTVINVTQLFAGKRQGIAAVIMELSKTEDQDVHYTQEVILRHGDFKLEWPDADATSGAITMTDLFLLAQAAKRDGIVLYDRQANAYGKLSNVEYREESMFRPEHIRWTMESAVSQGGKLIKAVRVGVSFEDKLFGKNLPLVPATDDQLVAAAAEGRALHQRLSGDTGFAHLKYSGIAYTPGWFGTRVPRAVDSRVVVDPEGLRLINQSRMESLVDLMGIDIKHDDNYDAITIADPTDADFAGLVRMAVMYDLSKGVWMLGHADLLTDITFREDAFDRLVLDPSRKRLVEALVVHNSAIRDNAPDIIDGKGGGCIFLLDGPPGTGKTLTAEATAEKLQRVLYKVGLGELGVDASSMEQRLSQILNTASRWDAVLLLDEADVFLEKRSTENLARNAMVAVFLRLLEYYSGLLFLTTNRGDNFDQAVISRVTLALHFRAQDEEGRATIWRNLLGNAKIEVSARELAALAALPVNGREIKNAINSSRALAAADGTGVTYQHLREIIDASTIFQEEVKSSKR